MNTILALLVSLLSWLPPGVHAPSGYQIPAWIPQSGLVFLYDPIAGVTLSGSNVTAIKDQSTNGYNMVAMPTPPTFTANSINGNPGLTSTGASNQGMKNASVTLVSNNHARTFIAVVKPAADYAQTIFDWRTSSQDFQLLLGLPSTFYVYGNGAINASVAATVAGNGTPLLAEWYSDGTNLTFDMNGVAKTLSSSLVTGGDTGAAGFSSGSRLSGGTGIQSFVGDIDIEAGWSRVLSSTETNGLREGVQQRFAMSLGITPILLTADSMTVSPLGTKTFVASGGAGAGYVCSIVTNASGGSINSSSCAYTAGGSTGIDVIRVADPAGFSATRNVAVRSTTPTIHISNSSRVEFVGDCTTLSAGGTGAAWWDPGFKASVNAALSPGSFTAIDEGHIGAQSADINTNFSAWITTQTPDIVYVTIGINDVTDGTKTPTGFIGNLSTTISQIQSSTTATQIAVTAIVSDGEVWRTGPIWGVNSPDMDARIDQFNSLAESYVNGIGNPHVIFIPFRQEALVWEVTNNPSKTATGHLTVDGIHSNSTGKTVEGGFGFAQVTAP